jgi:hypothetical protein
MKSNHIDEYASSGTSPTGSARKSALESALSDPTLVRPQKRGRPAKYRNDEERKAADAQRKRDKRATKRERNNTRQRRNVESAIRRLNKVPNHEAIELTNKILRAEGLSMSRGLFLTDAPRGQGLLIIGLPVVAISDANQVRQMVGGRRVRRTGYGSRFDEEGDARKQPQQSEYQFIEKHFRGGSALRCYRKGCNHLVVGILPQDHDKPRGRWRFHCFLHSPIFDFPGRFPISEGESRSPHPKPLAKIRAAA